MEIRLYPPLPVHEQVRRPFQWPKKYLLSKDDVNANKRFKKMGGRPKKGVVQTHIRIVEVLEKIEWATCLDLSLELDCSRKTVQGVVKQMHANGVLHRRRRNPHEYEYSLRETAEVNHDD